MTFHDRQATAQNFAKLKSERAAKTFVKFSHFVLQFCKFLYHIVVFQVLERIEITFEILFAAMLITEIIIFKAFHTSNLDMKISRCLYTFQQQHSSFPSYQTSSTSQGTLAIHLHQISFV